MEYRKETNGWQTFLQNGGHLVFFVIIGLILLYSFNLINGSWTNLFVPGFVLLVAGATLIVYAKLPAYRAGQFFTFGIRSVPDNRVKYYRWGWLVFLLGVVASLGLLLFSHR